MIRLNSVRLGGKGPIRYSRKCLLWWGHKEESLHRLARQRPWWENAAIFGGLLCFIQVTSLCFYFGNRWYQAVRPSGNDLYINSTMDAKVFSRPDLSVAAVRMIIHHALSGVQTPFGAPMVYPSYMKPEAEELMDFILQLHSEQPMFSIPDLWALFTAKALARLGGPSISVRRGRPDIADDLKKENLLVAVPSLLPETMRDVLNMKRALGSQGFSIDEIVAMLGGVRNIGFHESSGFHTTREVKPEVRRHRGLAGPVGDVYHLPDSIQKCTLDPYVFGSEYFDLLLDYNWKQEGLLKRKGNPFRCDEKDRRREILLLDPFSEKALERERKRLQAEERARNAVERAAVKRQLQSSGEELSVADRDGEAQPIRHMEVQGTEGSDRGDESLIDIPEFKSPCSSVSMCEVDMLLVDDLLLMGWVHRFSANEILFYNVFGSVVEKIHCHGYNINSLYLPS